MSQMGHQQSSAIVGVTSALLPIADLQRTSREVGDVPKADIARVNRSPRRPERQE